MTGWRSTRGVEEAIDDVASFERTRAERPRVAAGLNGDVGGLRESAVADPSLGG
jgi:hypothetical protein